MKIIRSTTPIPFTKLPNAALRDKTLSWRARGIHAFLLSHVDEGWPSDAKFLAEQGPDGRDACQKGLNELADHGYIERRKRRLPNGHWVTDIVVYDVPGTVDEAVDNANPQVVPEPDNQESENQESADQDSGNQESGDQESVGQESGKKTNQKIIQKTTEKIRISPRASAEQTVQETTDATEDETRELLRRIIAKHTPSSPDAYVRRMAEAGDLPAWLAELRAERPRQPAAPRAGVECPHGDLGGAALHPHTQQPLCPLCRAHTRGCEVDPLYCPTCQAIREAADLPPDPRAVYDEAG